MTEITLKRHTTSQLQFLCKQQEAVEWIEALLGSKVPDPDLSISLRDGTLLYSIMTKIKEGSMTKKPMKTTVPFKMSENAQQFINAAKAYGCTEVFLPGDLVNKTNVMNVLACLHNLAELAYKKGESPKWPGTEDTTPVAAPEKKIKKFGSVKVSHLKEEKEARSKRSQSEMRRVDPDKLRALLGEDDDVDIRLMSQSILRDEPTNQNANAGEKLAEQKQEEKKVEPEQKLQTEEIKPVEKIEEKPAEEQKAVAEEQKPVEEKKVEQKPVEPKLEEKKPEAEHKTQEQEQQHKPISQPEQHIEEPKQIEQKPAEQQKPVEQKPVEEKQVEQKPAEEKKVEPAPAQTQEHQRPKIDRKLSITETRVKDGKPVEVAVEKTEQASPKSEPLLTSSTGTPPGSPSISNLSEDEKMKLRAEKAERLRLRVIQEIISTERDYVRDLEKAVEIFVNPLRGFDFMEAGSVNAIFSNIEMIIQVNKQLLKKLEDRLEDSSPKYWIVGDIFLDMADYLKMYTVYCSNQELSLSTLDRYTKESEDFQSWIKEALKNPSLNGLTLRDFLVKPVQRICRYPLLLRELLKNTHDLHVDYDKLVGALSRMETLASYVNEAKRHEENLNKVLEIQRVVQGCDNLITPTRRFIREGDLTVIEKGKPKVYRGWLFTDMLMYAKTQRNISFSTKKGFYVYKDRIGFNDCIITDWPDSKDIKNAFQLQSISRAAKFVIGCSSKEEKDAWVEDITKATEALLQLDAAKKRMSLPTRSRGNSGADTTKRSSLNTVQAELLREYQASERTQEESNGESTPSTPKTRAASATENFNSLSKSTGSDALRESSEDDGKTRNWKKASQMSALDVMKELEEEKKKRMELEETQKQNDENIKNLQSQLKQAQETLEYEKKRREEQKKELEEVKERLVNSTMELMQLKDEQSGGSAPASPDPSKPPSRPPSVTNISGRRGSTNEATGGSDSPAPLRSWNKKVIYDVQEISRQLNNEKKARRELEEWKKEHEEKMEEMKKKVRTETDARIKMEEQHKKLQRELEDLRAAYAKASGK